MPSTHVILICNCVRNLVISRILLLARVPAGSGGPGGRPLEIEQLELPEEDSWDIGF